jgi:hypothetical protein
MYIYFLVFSPKETIQLMIYKERKKAQAHLHKTSNIYSVNHSDT